MLHFFYNFYLTQKGVNTKGYWYNAVFWKLYRILKHALPKYYQFLPNTFLGVNPNSEIAISLTSFPARIDIVFLTIKSILNQSYKPKKVTLWLASEQFKNKEQDLPASLLKLQEKGLEIIFCIDLKSHKKYFFSFQNDKNDKIITIDDDVIYPKDMIKTLVDFSNKYSNCVIANRVRTIEFHQKELKPYRSWPINNDQETLPSKLLFPTGVGGVLYKPAFFSEKLFDVKTINELCLNADDVWLKANALVNNIEVVFTNKYFNPFVETPNSQKESLFSANVFSSHNDEQIQGVFQFFNINLETFNNQL